jgi:STE24 endopeptidase
MSEMTATRIARWTTLAAGAVAWLVVASLLYRTSVPHLDLGGLDVHRFFTDAELRRAQRYERFVYLVWLAATVSSLVALTVLVRRAPRIAWSIGLGPIGSGVIVGMLTLVTLWFVSLPFGIALQWWDHRHGLAPGDYLAWLLAPWATLSFEAAYAMGTIVLVMSLARKLGERWWIAGGAVFVALAVGFAMLFGWLAGAGTKPIPAGYRADVTRLERIEHVTGTPVTVQKVSDYTHEVNAYSAGVGPSARVVLWDTLLDGRLGHGEVRVVLAHELGHVWHRHIWKGLAWFALFAFPGAWLVARVTRRHGGMGEPAAIPLAVLTLVVAGLAATPFENVVSRRYEAEADWSALQATRDAPSGARLFERFQRTSLAEPNPPTWAYVLLETHPTLAQRLAMVEAWKRRNAGR